VPNAVTWPFRGDGIALRPWVRPSPAMLRPQAPTAAHPGHARLLRVTRAGIDRKEGLLRMAGLVVPCVLGRSGISHLKREGDGATPAGTWPLRCVLYRPDRLPAPSTGLPLIALRPDDGWCDAPEDRAYNRPVRLPHPRSAEALWRADRLYDLVVVLGYNDRPAIAGRGSAVFLHLAAPDGGATAGCVAVRRSDLLRILVRCGPRTLMHIG
jgi:L,D-peptidoglycan transpeptidase YkuD (ErfK/YbiS/YcfS/YnhG family)